MKIAVLSTSDSIGGAAIVTTSLVNALRARGNDVLYLTMPGKRELRPSYLAERLGIFLRNGLRRDSLFKVSMGDFGIPGVVERVSSFAPDAIVLGWINQGFLSLKEISALSHIAPTYWVMHDMWSFTGICHYSFGCMHFTGSCGACPMLSPRMRSPHDLSHKGWRRKQRFYEHTPMKFIAVSSWVKEMALRSSLLSDAEVTVIPNVYPLEDFAIAPAKEPGLIVMGAERLDNPIKGLHHAVSALNLLPPDADARVVFFGGYKDVSALRTLRIPYELTGPLTPPQVRELLSRAQVVLSTALYETFGNTLLEGQASGAVPVSFNRGGQVDIIEHKESGFLADFGDVEAIARGIGWALSDDAPSPRSLRQASERKFSAAAVAARYERMLGSQQAAQ